MLGFMKKIGVSYLFSALISITLGIVLIVWPKLSHDVFCLIVGCAAIIFGCALFIYHLASSKRKDFLINEMIIGLLVILVGFLFIFKMDAMNAILGIILGVLLVFHGLVNIQESFVLKHCGNRKWFVFGLISLLFLLLGLVILFVPGISAVLFTYLLGVGLTLAGLFEIVLFFILRKYVQISEKEEKLIVANSDIIIK